MSCLFLLFAGPGPSSLDATLAAEPEQSRRPCRVDHRATSASRAGSCPDANDQGRLVTIRAGPGSSANIAEVLVVWDAGGCVRPRPRHAATRGLLCRSAVGVRVAREGVRALRRERRLAVRREPRRRVQRPEAEGRAAGAGHEQRRLLVPRRRLPCPRDAELPLRAHGVESRRRGQPAGAPLDGSSGPAERHRRRRYAARVRRHQHRHGGRHRRHVSHERIRGLPLRHEERSSRRRPTRG